MKFVWLTAKYRPRAVYVNMEQVRYIEWDQDEKCSVLIFDDRQSFSVGEELDDIRDLLKVDREEGDSPRFRSYETEATLNCHWDSAKEDDDKQRIRDLRGGDI